MNDGGEVDKEGFKAASEGKRGRRKLRRWMEDL